MTVPSDDKNGERPRPIPGPRGLALIVTLAGLVLLVGGAIAFAAIAAGELVPSPARFDSGVDAPPDYGFAYISCIIAMIAGSLGLIVGGIAIARTRGQPIVIRPPRR
jgi:hypothetical protein